MNAEELYSFKRPELFFNASEKLNKKEFLADNRSKPYRDIWIGSRFCHGLNLLKQKKFKVALIKDNFQILN